MNNRASLHTSRSLSLWSNSGWCRIALLLLALGIAGCATKPKPKPLPHVEALLAAMDEAQAVQLLQQLLPPRNHYGNPARTTITGYIGMGLCRVSEVKLDEDRGPGLRVSREGISFNAVKTGAPVSEVQQGRIVRDSNFSSIRKYDRVSYREHFNFENIAGVSVTEPRLMRTVCSRQNGQSEVVVVESTSRWYAVLIPSAEKERFVAAMMKLRPGVSITTELEDD